MQYFTLEGDYLSAYHFCQKNGGQLFCGNGKDSANVCLIGQKCYTFWAKDSKRKRQVEELAEYFGLNPEGQTGGRIARWLIDDLIKGPYGSTFWSKTYRNLAKDGSHWHYTHCQEKQVYWGIEVDIKSAYFASLFTFPSLLYHPSCGYLDDKGSMDNLKILYKDFPKWFRLQLLGCASSWRIYYLTRNKGGGTEEELIRKCRMIIKYNALFNVAHRAILRNYKVMQKIHQIGGKYIRRMHTDSFFLDIDIPGDKELEIWDYVASKGLEYSIKGAGQAWFWDLNTGFIGNKFVGAHIDVCEHMRRENIKMKRNSTNAQILQSDSIFLRNDTSGSANKLFTDSSDKQEYRQLEFFEHQDNGDYHSLLSNS
jgi:hypothetical protein